jgi:6-phosphogluconolactonase/glucosamine-6-phosphate isomerase/deaminase
MHQSKLAPKHQNIPYPSIDSLAQAIAQLIIKEQKPAIKDHASFNLLFTPTSIVSLVFQVLASELYSAQLNWHKFHLYPYYDEKMFHENLHDQLLYYPDFPTQNLHSKISNDQQLSDLLIFENSNIQPESHTSLPINLLVTIDISEIHKLPFNNYKKLINYTKS